VAELFADRSARYGFLQLADRQPAGLEEFNDRWWQAVWSGEVSADALTPLRQGTERDYKLTGHRPPRARPRAGRARAPRYARSAFADPWSGTWFLIPQSDPEPDALLDLEDAKERVRMLVDRYGLACRELANREGGLLRWASIFRALRVMELAGEVVAGHFFEGLSGPQFVPPSAVVQLQGDAPVPRNFWCNALDPVSPCGLGIDWPALPQRRAQNYLAFQDGALALVIENLGKRLTFHLDPADCEPAGVLAPLVFLLGRQRRVTILTVNGLPARDSTFLPVLQTVGRLVSDHRASYLEAHPGINR
jgi:ATP-dependent Lhr-like helicase